MTRLVPLLCAACAVGIGLTAWSQLSASDVDFEVPGGSPPTNGTGRDAGESGGSPGRSEMGQLQADLEAARRKCAVEALDEMVTRLEAHAAANPDDAASHLLLAEALLERAQQRSHLVGLRVGEPVYTELPADLDRDLERGLGACSKARELGDESGRRFRIEAGLMSQRITGLKSAWEWNGRIAEALEAANERAATDPLLQTALGLRKLLAPPFFGHDAAKALEHFEFAAEARPDDERPAVFAGMANYLQQKRTVAIEWLERAVERNPNNRFARAVLRRLRRGEEQPFGRDVTAAELAEAK